jgi:hypothetical protein
VEAENEIQTALIEHLENSLAFTPVTGCRKSSPAEHRDVREAGNSLSVRVDSRLKSRS